MKMRAAQAAVHVLLREGVTTAFGLPGAAINPVYAAMRSIGGINHILARHVEGASHMAEGYSRARFGNIGVCIGTSGPAGTDMITGLYSAIADSIPILCLTGQAPRARLYKEDFQAVDIEAIAKPVTKWAVTVREPALVPRVLQQAFHVMRSGRPGPVLVDLPFDVQMGEIEFDPDLYAPLPVYRPAATRPQIDKALAMLAASQPAAHRRGRRRHQRRRGRSPGRVRGTVRRARDPDADGLGRDPGPASADGRNGRLADAASLRQRDDAGERLRARHRQPLGEPPHRLDRRLHARAQVRPRRHRADPDRPCLRSRPGHRVGCQGRAADARRSGERAAATPAGCRTFRRGPKPAASASAPCSAEPTTTTRRSSRSASMPR